jgi:hypothetical protein
MKSDRMLVAALWGGALMGVLSALPFINIANCCCLWVMTGGLIAAYIFQSNAPPGVVITAGDGALCGLLAGSIGAFIFAVVAIPVNLVLGPIQQRFVRQLIESSPDVPDQMRGLFTDMGGGSSAAGTIVTAAVGFMVMLVAGAIFSTLGGLLGSALFRRNPRTPPPDHADGAVQ